MSFVIWKGGNRRPTFLNEYSYNPRRIEWTDNPNEAVDYVYFDVAVDVALMLKVGIVIPRDSAGDIAAWYETHYTYHNTVGRDARRRSRHKKP